MKSKKLNNVIYRKAHINDAQSIVDISLTIWRTTYKGLIKDEIIEARFNTYDKRVDETINLIMYDNGFIVAEAKCNVIGFIHYLKSDDEKHLNYGMIKALYIKDGYQRNGMGKILFMYAVREMKSKGFERVVIDCLVKNSANEFYLKMGTTIDSIKEELFMNETLIEYVHVYDLAKLNSTII